MEDNNKNHKVEAKVKEIEKIDNKLFLIASLVFLTTLLNITFK